MSATERSNALQAMWRNKAISDTYEPGSTFKLVTASTALEEGIVESTDKEGEFWDLFNGGKIQYCRYPVSYNREAQKTLVRRAMDKGFYEGCNLALSYCEDCGYEQLDMDVCPKCGSENITQIDRMNGYIGYTKIHGKSRYNQAKVIEISERKSM